LRLSGTKISDHGVRALEGAKALRSLAVADTGVTAAALAPLKARGVTVYGGGDGP
jgi:hypothetical protein